MKKRFTLLLCLALILGMTACGGRSGPDPVPPRESSTADAPSASSGEAAPPAPAPEAPESQTPVPEEPEEIEGASSADFTVPIVDLEDNPLEGSASFTIWFPDTWSLEDRTFYNEEGLKAAEVMPALPYADNSIFDRLAEKYPDGDPIEVTLGGLSGKYYYSQTPSSDPAFATSFDDVIIYCVKREDHLLRIGFFPLRGAGGVGPQRERFQSAIQRIK